MENRFDRSTFESSEFLIESAEAPKIKAGGSSSSNILNRYFSALSQDVTLLATRTNILAARSARVEKGCSAQGGALLAAFQAVSTRVDAASGYNQVLADMHSMFYVDGSNTSTIEQTFGQSTLPVLSQTDLLVQQDVYGNSYVSSETQVSYCTKTASSINLLALEDFVIDPEAIFMLRDQQTWILDKQAGQTQGWVRIKAPLQFRGLTPNVLEIWPFPSLGMKLKAVYYRIAGSTIDAFVSVPLNYLPQYDGTSAVNNLGPIRIHLDNLPLSELAFCFDVSSVNVWGMKQIKLWHTEYDSTADLVVKDPYSRTVGDIVIRGKDPSQLSQLQVTKIGNKATIKLVTTDSSKTPVITGVIMKVT